MQKIEKTICKRAFLRTFRFTLNSVPVFISIFLSVLLSASLSVLFSILLSVFLSASLSASPLDDAAARWEFADENDSNANDGKNSVLKPFGDVQLGTKSQGAHDGFSARFSGNGWLSAEQGADGELNVSGNALTIYVRLKPGPISTSYPIFSKHGGHGNMAYNLFAFSNYIGTEIGTTGNGQISNGKDEKNGKNGEDRKGKKDGLSDSFLKHPLHAKALFSKMREPESAASRWLDVAVRVDEAKMELFVDGRCVDEDFVVGTLNQNSVPLLIGAQDCGSNQTTPGFVGEIDTAAVWNRTLSVEEIQEITRELSGADKIDCRERTDRGNGENLQYWCPPNEYSVGDCMPFCVNGVFHCMYLLDKGHHSSKNGKGAHQWIQATSRDLVHWEHQPFVVPITQQNEGSICTGSVFYNDGVYYAFYANRSMDRGGILEISTSRDGIRFEKQSGPLVLMPEGYSGSLRDPVVFRGPDDGLFHMYATTSYRGRGCWAHIVSTDLKHWKLRDPVYLRSTPTEPECPDWFKMGDFYYTISQNEYFISRSPQGPWVRPASNSNLMQGIVRVPKTAPFGEENRRLIVGWTAQHGFGGNLVFHELVSLPPTLTRPAGQLGTKFVQEMIPASGSPILELQNQRQKGESARHAIPDDFRLQASLSFDPHRLNALLDLTFQIGTRKQIRLCPASGCVFVDDQCVENVDFSTGKIVLDVVVKGELCDVCIDDSFCITSAIPTENENCEFFIRDDSELLNGSYDLNAAQRAAHDTFSTEAGYTIEKLTLSPLL